MIPHIPRDPEGSSSSTFQNKKLRFREVKEFIGVHTDSTTPKIGTQECLTPEPLFLQGTTPPERSLAP